MTNRPSQWMTIREAALALAVSELTIRRRIKDGRLAHRFVNGKYYIDLESAPEAGDTGADGEPPRPSPTNQADQHAAHAASGEVTGPVSSTSANGNGAASPSASGMPDGAGPDGSEPARGPKFDLDALLAEHARLAETAGRARLLEDQLAQLSAQHEELRNGMLSLAGRNGWLESKLEERESELKLLTDEQPRRSWWKRLFGA